MSRRTLVPKFVASLIVALVCLPLSAAGLTRTEKKIVKNVDAQIPGAIELLQKSVEIPSKTSDLEGVRKVGDLFASELKALGFDTRWSAMPSEMHRAGHLIAERHGKKGKRLLLIGHLDTVLEGEPWSSDGKIAHGNGAADMKGGDVIIIEALRALQKAHALDDASIIVVFSGDEEDTGKPVDVARRDMVDAAKRSDIALGFEGTVRDTATIARRGISSWKLETTGETGHSSGIFREKGSRGAIFEAARILDAFYTELGHEKYLSFNPSVIVGGTEVTYDDENQKGSAEGKLNVIPHRVVVQGDLRYISRDQLETTRAAMQAIVAKSLPGTSASITFQDGFPSMPPTEGNYAVLRELDQASRDLGFGPIKALDPGMRGAGDIAFVADDVNCLDGLGAMGGRSHSPEEWTNLETMPMLIKRAAVLIYRLTR